jgi:hypothetical protein
VARGNPQKPATALKPDELIKTGKDGRIRLLEKRKPRRPSMSGPSAKRKTR